MTNLVLIGNIISILASNPATNFSLVASHAQADEQMLMEEHSIDTWDEYWNKIVKSVNEGIPVTMFNGDQILARGILLDTIRIFMDMKLGLAGQKQITQ